MKALAMPFRDPQRVQEAASQIVAAAPSVAAVTAPLLGVHLQLWLQILGLVFIALQIGYLVWKWRRDIKREEDREDE